MKKASYYLIKLLQIFIPTLLSILAIWGLLTIQEFLHNQFSGPDVDVHIDNDLIFVLPLTFIALIFQILLVLPIWYKFQANQKLFNLTLNQFVLLVCVLGAILFGFLFWAPQFGIRDLLMSILIGFVSMGTYWVVNLLTLNNLPK
jgi:hypothetical protein